MHRKLIARSDTQKFVHFPLVRGAVVRDIQDDLDVELETVRAGLHRSGASPAKIRKELNALKVSREQDDRFYGTCILLEHMDIQGRPFSKKDYLDKVFLIFWEALQKCEDISVQLFYDMFRAVKEQASILHVRTLLQAAVRYDSLTLNMYALAFDTLGASGGPFRDVLFLLDHAGRSGFLGPFLYCKALRSFKTEHIEELRQIIEQAQNGSHCDERVCILALERTTVCPDDVAKEVFVSALKDMLVRYRARPQLWLIAGASPLIDAEEGKSTGPDL